VTVGLSFSPITKAHSQEIADRGYPLSNVSYESGQVAHWNPDAMKLL
jgi:hypothetical protein